MRRFSSLFVLTLLFVGPLLGANAHFVAEGGTVWEQSGKCLKNRTEISHGRNGTGYVAVRAKATEEDESPVHCPARWVRPAGYLKVKFHFMKWVVGYGWAQCYDSRWRKNSSSGSEFELYHHVPEGGPSCGASWYAVFGRTKVKHNGAWRPSDRGGVWAKKHWLPCEHHGEGQCPDDDASPAYAPPPDWIGPNGEVIASKFPSQGLAQLGNQVGNRGQIIGYISLAEFNSEAEDTRALSTTVYDGVETVEFP